MEVPKKDPLAIIRHKGPLTIASLDMSISGAIFRPASKKLKRGSKRSLYYLGWEYTPPKKVYEFILERLESVSAEGIVTLAALVECLRSQCDCRVEVKVDSKGKSWKTALHLNQLIDDNWALTLPGSPSNIDNSWAFPLWRYPLKSYVDCERTAERISKQVLQLLERLGYEKTVEVAAATKTVFTEALLNILEHAYSGKQERFAFEAITITPAPELTGLQPLPNVSKEELTWFEENEGRRILEIAVADIGRNVPTTLWRAYCLEFPEACSQAAGLNLGSTSGQIARAKLHQDISEWAFDHKSTRKTPKEFKTELALLNWRGLHRALNTTFRLGGCLVMRSGQARAGYAFDETGSRALSETETKQHDFPGTSIILRVPIVTVTRHSSTSISKVRLEPSKAQVIKLDKIVNRRPESLSLKDLPAGEVGKLGIAHPFKHYQEADLKDLLNLIRQIPPFVVSFHFFASLDSLSLLEQLPAFHESTALDLGPPRLTAFHKPGEDLIWKFVGVIPARARSFVSQLETSGIADLGQTPELRSFAEGLASTYAPLIRLNGSSLELVDIKAELSDESYSRAMQLAFQDWASTSKQWWLYDGEGEVVRLMTGHLVRKYVSVLRALDSDESFARAVGQKFSVILRKLKRSFPNFCIVTESEASYFIARVLLLDYEEPLDIFIASPPNKNILGRPVIVFADAIYKGQTLNFLLKSKTDCKAVICGIDLRQDTTEIIGEKLIPFTPLLCFPLERSDVEVDSEQQFRRILEVDTVTHIPYEKPSPETFQIGTDAERQEFISRSSRFFRYGLHRSGGRLHTVSLSNDEFIDRHRKQIVSWVYSIVRSVIERLPYPKRIKSVVFFVRNESSIKEITTQLGGELKTLSGSMEGFSAIIPVVPSSRGEVFSSPSQELFYGLQSLGSEELLFASPTDFLAVYLDDACVTGKTLLNFLIQVSKAQPSQLPAAVVAVPTLSRLSPAEETFYRDVCRTLGPSEGSPKRIPFFFNPLFRLQIRSFERIQTSPVYELIGRFLSKLSGLDMRLQKYVLKIGENIGADSPVFFRGQSAQLPFQHPFYSGQKGEPCHVSGRALRIRHLIALLEQNVGVLSEVLSEMLGACAGDDYTLLNLLALEPDLLVAAPISRECRKDLTDLSMRALSADETDEATKSDALAVLALQGQPVINRISEILMAISGKQELIDQLLVFLLVQSTPKTLLSTAMTEGIQNCASHLSQSEFSYVRGCIKGVAETTSPPSIHNANEARQAIRTLIARTSIHGQGHSALKAVNNWFLKRPGDRYSSSVQDVRLIIKEALAVVRSAIWPGLDGLRWWAEHESYAFTPALAFRDAWFQVIINVNNLESLLDSLHDGPIGREVADDLEEMWKTIRDNSQINAPDTYLSGSIMLGQKKPLLENWTPAFFSAPFEVAVNLALRLKIAPEITSSWEEDEQGLYLVVTPIPLDAISEVFRLLFEDMLKHGIEDSHFMRFSTEVFEGQKTLIALFQDTVIDNDMRGAGKSQTRARWTAEQHGFRVIYEDHTQKRAGDTYTVRVIFNDFLYIKCE